jgi:hypothetical protein
MTVHPKIQPASEQDRKSAERKIRRLETKIMMLEAENDMYTMVIHDLGAERIEAHIRAKFPSIPYSSVKPARYEDTGDTVKDGAYNAEGGPL